MTLPLVRQTLTEPRRVSQYGSIALSALFPGPGFPARTPIPRRPTRDGAAAGSRAAMAASRALSSGLSVAGVKEQGPWRWSRVSRSRIGKKRAPGDRPSCDGAPASETGEKIFLQAPWGENGGWSRYRDTYLKENGGTVAGTEITRRRTVSSFPPSHPARHRFHVPRSAPLCWSLIFSVAAAPGF